MTETVKLSHGAGGATEETLIQQLFLKVFEKRQAADGIALDALDDGASIRVAGSEVILSIDGHTVDPIFFPGGNIGSLAVHGTVNDVAMMGAVPMYLTCGFILEEGLPMADLEKIVEAMGEAARHAGVNVVTGDTKVVPRGKCDKIFINTSGIGTVPEGLDLDASHLQAGDQLILSGTVGDHGMAVLTSRERLSFTSHIQSDTAALHDLVALMLREATTIRCLRDPTRGGVATTVNEFAAASHLGVVIEETAIPVRPAVRGACEVLGIDPLTVANEGKLLAVVGREEANHLLRAMQGHALGVEARIIGQVVDEHHGLVALRTSLGVKRILEMPLAEQLPRIC